MSDNTQTIYNANFLGDDKLREYNIFAEEYFTGTDIKLFANGTNIKQISMIQFELQEQLKPIYGYNSYTYDDVAVGSRIVTGTFVCPIKNVAKNKEFKCSPDKKYKKGTTNDLRDYNYQIDRELEKTKKQYKTIIKNETAYLSPNFDIPIFYVENEDVIVKDEGKNFLQIYTLNGNKTGYIKKG